MQATRTIKCIAGTVVAISALIVVGFGTNLFGHSQFVVESGSMQPAIMTGSVVLDAHQASYAVGDVITFQPIGSKDTITHRIVKQVISDGETGYIVKGDANNAPDPNPVPLSTVRGKVVLAVPLIGYAINAVRSLPGLLALIVIPATIIIYQEVIGIIRQLSRIRTTRRETRVQLVAPGAGVAPRSALPLPMIPGQPQPKHHSSEIILPLVALVVGVFGLSLRAQLTGADFSSNVTLTGLSIQATAYGSD